MSIGTVIVAHQVGRRRCPGEGLGDLLRQPLCCRMPGHLEPQQLPSAVARTTNANKRSKVSVGTTHMSTAAIASAWFSRNVFQDCEGGLRPRIMYLETVDCAISNPSISSSPWIRGAPQSGFSPAIRRMRSRSSRSTFGRPALFRDFQRQNVLKPERCHRKIVSGFTTWDTSSRVGQIRIIHTNSARSLPCSRRRGGARLKAMLS